MHTSESVTLVVSRGNPPGVLDPFVEIRSAAPRPSLSYGREMLPACTLHVIAI
jgi:hypothetical protein